MPLSDTKVRSAKPLDKAYKLSDEKGLSLLVNRNGSKYWRFKYRLQTKEKLLALGVYPDVSLKDARAKRDEARSLLASDINPSVVKKATKLLGGSDENCCAAVAAEWYGKRKAKWSDTHADKIERLLEKDLTPYLGARPVGEVTPLNCYPYCGVLNRAARLKPHNRQSSWRGRYFDTR